MTGKIPKGFGLIICILIIAAATQLNIHAQVRGMMPIPPTPVSTTTQTLTGVIRIPKDFGIVPNGPGLHEAAPIPCNPFFVAVFDADDLNKLITYTDAALKPGSDDGNFYTCKYSLKVPASKRLYAIAGMSSPKYLEWKKSPPAQYVSDAWVGGTNNKPPRGYERGFAGKFVTLGTVKGTYLKFDMYYAQVDPD